MNAIWPRPPKIVVLTGAGLSRESGFAPFDAAAMPEGVSLEDVLTPAGFERDPARVQAFYNERRRQLLAVKPNPAHEALAVFDLVRKGEVVILTRNIDDLHERAGSQAVLHTHGELLKARCTICTKVSAWHDDITGSEDCPVCGNAGHLRPHIVRVGEHPLRMDTAYEALAHCDRFLAIGVSGGGEPARSFLAAARRAHARTVEFTCEPAPNSDLFDERIDGPASGTVPDYVKRLIAET